MQGIAKTIWESKYRLKRFDGTPVDETVNDTWKRIARALAAKEKEFEFWSSEFYGALADFKFLPAGRIIAGAGTGRDVTLFNCYVMGTIPDSMAGIFDMLKEAALTMQQGGGIGYDFSTIRPKGAEVKGVESEASGPLTFMDCWDAMCRTVMSAGSRRGAMMATMRCDHPDILDFIKAKQESSRLRMFNLSVLVTDKFMEAVANNKDWTLSFNGVAYKVVKACDLWEQIMRATYDYAEPGVIFIDRINADNNLNYCETIAATNPCGEQPLPPYGACLLGSINLTRFILRPFVPSGAVLNESELRHVVQVAVRMMDNVNDVSIFPLLQQHEEAQAKRRIGLGVTGLADALAMLGHTYGDEKSVQFTERVMKFIAEEAYQTSALLAKEKGAFPAYDPEKFLVEGGTSFVNRLSERTRDLIRKYGLRNSHLTSIAPTGTISLFAGNVSSGIEPIFAETYTRKVLQPDGSRIEEKVEDYAVSMWNDLHPSDKLLPPQFVTAQNLPPSAHLEMQAAAQKWVDSSISKTINLPRDISFDDFESVYLAAYNMGCKGCTTYRPNDVTGSILSVDSPPEVPAPEPQPVAHVVPPRSRVMHGATYKMKWPGYRHAIYVTINDDPEGNPFEVFFNTKGIEHTAWMSALALTISAVLRKGGDVSFIVDELKEVHDPKGGAWDDGVYVPSMIAKIGLIIQEHMQGIEVDDWNASDADFADADILAAGSPPGQCPSCGEYATHMQSGCITCTSCGHSKCG